MIVQMCERIDRMSEISYNNIEELVENHNLNHFTLILSNLHHISPRDPLLIKHMQSLAIQIQG